MRSILLSAAVLAVPGLAVCTATPRQWTILGEHAKEAMLAVGGRSESSFSRAAAEVMAMASTRSPTR